ncbi:MAG: CDP-alcohol phosphatidyltransferase family protein [Chitinophagaceae bacterium]|nr:CDP-alcohol phosphatidyltransferase family protein [Chitinophagaceae bacterium]
MSYYVINGITLYRIVTAPLLLVLLFLKQYDLFKWLLAVSFFTDLIDGFLARKYKVTSVLGTKLDSIGDDLTVAVAVTGLFVMYPGFIQQQKWMFISLLILFFTQTIFAFFRYGKMTNFHTWLAKTAALLQGIFLLLTFFTGKPILPFFYIAIIITMLELIEEIVLVYLLPEWEANIKGIYWVFKRRRVEE